MVPACLCSGSRLREKYPYRVRMIEFGVATRKELISGGMRGRRAKACATHWLRRSSCSLNLTRTRTPGDSSVPKTCLARLIGNLGPLGR